MRLAIASLVLCACGGAAPKERIAELPDGTVLRDAAEPAGDASKPAGVSTLIDMSMVAVDMARSVDLAMCIPDLAPCTKGAVCCVHPGLGVPQNQNVYATCDLATNTCRTYWDVYNCPLGQFQSCYSSEQGDVCSGCP